jgi:hypothetical protein
MIPQKQVFLFSILFLVLLVSLFYYGFLQRQPEPKPLRIDPIPDSAYVVPWMQPNPSIEQLNLHAQQPYGPLTYDIDSVMANVLKLSTTFNISIPDGTRVIPSTVYLGHDSEYLYVGGKFQGMGMNPASTDYDTLPNLFSILFDVANNGVLKQPESGSRFPVYITKNWRGGWSYDDAVWAYIPQDGRASWVPSDNYYTLYLGKPQTVWSDGGETSEYDNSTATVIMLFSRLLSCPGNAEVNELQMRPGERWVMGFVLELSYVTNIGSFGDYVDGWPQKTYPYLSSNSSWWPKLAIDLSNPPPSF